VSDPLVSILIPAFNCRPWVGVAIESALRQSWSHKEVIVLDDCSTDGTWDVLHDFRDLVHVERATSNRGQNASRNQLTELSYGEWLLYLDADDELQSDAVEEKLKHAETCDAVYGTMEVATFHGGIKTDVEVVVAQEFADPIAAAFQWRFPNTSSFMFRRSAVVESGGWNPAIRNCTDYDLYFRLLLGRRQFHAAPRSVTIYRQWSGSQAVNQDVPRKIRTRLDVMWKAARELRERGELTWERRNAFASAAMTGLRPLYHSDPREAIRQARALKQWLNGYRLLPTLLPFKYRVAHKLFGFRGAELIADMARIFKRRPEKPPPFQ
jgi:glycosyltransferase involved in cell wall biosynthesis